MDNYKKLFVLVLMMAVVLLGTIACNNTSEPAGDHPAVDSAIDSADEHPAGDSADEHPAGEHPSGDSADEHPAGEHPE